MYQCNLPYEGVKEEKNQVFILTDAEKVFEKVKNIHDKNSPKIGINENFPNLLNNMYNLLLSLYLMLKD